MITIRPLQIASQLLFLLLVFVSSAYAARIVSLSTCESISDPGMIPERITDQFTADAPKIHAVLVLDQVKAGLEITGIWVSVDAIEVPNYQIDSTIVKVKDKETRVHFVLSRPTNGWPQGKYKLDIYFDDNFVTSVPFSISGKASDRKQAEAMKAVKKGPGIVSISTCESVSDPGMIPERITDQFTADAPKIHAVLVLDQVKAGLEIKGIWVSVDAIEVPNYQIDSTIVKVKDKETRVHFALSRPTNGWPQGKYKLDIYFDDNFVTSVPFSISGKASDREQIEAVKIAKKSPGTDLLGKWVCRTEYGSSFLEFKSEKNLTLDGAPFIYSISGNALRIKDETGTNDYPFTLKDGILTIKFAKGYSMAYTRTDSVPTNNMEEDKPNYQEEQVPSQPDMAGSSDLMRHFAGTWWNATTNTETEVTLTADGQYFESSTASYSGSSSDQYGNQDMSYGSASDKKVQGTWTVRGNMQEGEITITYQDGSQRVIPYQVHVENGQAYWSEYYFNGVLYGKK